MRRSQRCGLAVAVVTLLLLAGCSPDAPNPGGTDDPIPGSNETPVASLAAPDVRSSATCAELVDAGTLGGWFDTERTVDETAPLDDLDGVAVRTSQSLRCSWEGDIDSEFGNAASFLRLWVHPVTDGGDGYRDDTQYFVDDNYTDFDTVGDDSVFYCSSYGDLWSCAGEMLVGDYWVTAQLQALTDSALPETQAKLRMKNTLQRISSKLRNVPLTGSAWVLPAGAATGAGICTKGAKPARQILGDAFDLTKVLQAGGEVYMTDYTTYRLSHSMQCDFYKGKVYLGVALVPGAAWWGDSWDAVDLHTFTVTGLDPIDIDGVDRAMVGCDDGDCAAYLITQGSAVLITSSGLKRDRFVAGLASVPELIAL